MSKRETSSETVTKVVALAYSSMWRVFYSDGTNQNVCTMTHKLPRVGDKKAPLVFDASPRY